MITVEDLIGVLQTIPNQQCPVKLTNDYGIALDIQNVTTHKFLTSFVVLGTNKKFEERTGERVIWNDRSS